MDHRMDYGVRAMATPFVMDSANPVTTAPLDPPPTLKSNALLEPMERCVPPSPLTHLTHECNVYRSHKGWAARSAMVCVDWGTTVLRDPPLLPTPSRDAWMITTANQPIHALLVSPMSSPLISSLTICLVQVPLAIAPVWGRSARTHVKLDTTAQQVPTTRCD